MAYFEDFTIPSSYHLVNTPKKLAWLLDTLGSSSELGVDIETNHPTWKGKKKLPPSFVECICGISFAWGRTEVTDPWRPGNAGYIPLTDADDRPIWGAQQLPVMQELRNILESDIPKVAQNGKFDEYKLAELGDIQLRNFAFCTMLAHALFDEERLECTHALKSNTDAKGNITKLGMADHYLATEEASLWKGDLDKALDHHDPALRRYSKVPIDQLYPYGCADPDLTLSLKFVFEKRLEEEGLLDLFRSLIMPLSHSLTKMELHGVPLDIPTATRIRDEQLAVLRQSEQQIYEIVNTALNEPGTPILAQNKFNVGSPTQLGRVLFNPRANGGLGLTGDKTPDGKWRTDADALKNLNHPIADPLLAYRRAEQIHGHYAEAALAKVKEVTNNGTIGWVHPQYWMDSKTGRLKCTEPNLNTLPRAENGGDIVKEMWAAGEGYTFIFADFSQIELRVIAHVSQEPVWIEGFCAGHDMHSAMAKKIWNLDCAVEEVAELHPDKRSGAKAVNFGIAYGESEYSLAQRLGMTVDEANKLIHEDYFGAAPVLRQWIETTHRYLEDNGRVNTIFGRVRHLPDAQIVVPKGLPWPDKEIRPSCYRDGAYPHILGIESGEIFETPAEVLRNLIKYRKLTSFDKCRQCTYLKSCVVNREVRYLNGKKKRALRQGVNSPIQGSAVDMTSLSLIWIDEDFKTHRLPAAPILHIHDELMIYCRTDVVEQVKEIMTYNMTTRMAQQTQFSVPIKIDIKVTDRWSEK